MIIVTGPGHSGTRVIARIYDALGFGPSHRGFDFQETGDTVEIGRLNQEICNALGTGFRGRHQLLERIFGRYDPYPRVLDWARLERVSRTFRSQLLDYSLRLDMVKDPMFTKTLLVWLLAGCGVEQVLVVMRNLDDTISSRVAQGKMNSHHFNRNKNMMVYNMGLLFSTMAEYQIPHEEVLFPDCLDYPDKLYEKMRFPGEVDYDEFKNALVNVVDRRRIHEYQPKVPQVLSN